ncbi:riboflavin synthase [Curtanaerobium respiraculi]|uniref:riboflavin synthase n=1 Tax=Curtanaerobium respiraculi TaxID=2949669 RepID=UPI0024B34157|nr:riboflavin synthase [Curtanaerobium respiraculi]
MFTGIIEEIGTVERVLSGARAGSITIAAARVLEDAHAGDSIAVNGACLTVTSFDARSFTADVMPETLRRTGLGQLHAGDPVNLERAMAADGRFGGHIVSGHIDGTGRIARIAREQNARILRIETTPAICSLIVEKGSIAIDGTSLTVATVERDAFTVSIIPHTVEATALLRKPVGTVVNLENDIVGKYVQKLIAPGTAPPTPSPPGKSGLTLDYLQANGF